MQSIDDLIAHYEPMTDAYGAVRDAHRLAIALKNARGALRTLGFAEPNGRGLLAASWVREVAAEGLKEEP